MTPQLVEPIDLNLRLQPKQAKWFQTPATEMFVGGAQGGGKTAFNKIVSILWCLEIPGLQVYLFRRTYKEILKNYIEGDFSYLQILAPLINAGKCKFTDNVIRFIDPTTGKFDTGSRIHLNHCQYIKDVYAYDGTEIHVLMIDELVSFERDIYTYLRGRLRSATLADRLPEKYKGLFPRIICSGMPRGIGHNWVKQMFVSPVPEGTIWRAPDDDGGMLRVFMESFLEDNKLLTKNDPDYHKRIMGQGDDAMTQARLYGNWDITSGGMFDDIWDQRYHVVKAFKIPKEWYIDRSFDWGSTKPFSVGYHAESDGTTVEKITMRNKEGKWQEFEDVYFPPGTIFRFKEWYGCRKDSSGRVVPNEGLRLTTDEIAEGIINIDNELVELGYVINDGPADPSIYDDSRGESVGEQLEIEGVYWEKADNKRVPGWQKIRRMLKASKEFPRETPGIFVVEDCREFIRTVPGIPRDARKEEDVDSSCEDHIADEFRYRINDITTNIETIEVTGY